MLEYHIAASAHTVKKSPELMMIEASTRVSVVHNEQNFNNYPCRYGPALSNTMFLLPRSSNDSRYNCKVGVQASAFDTLTFAAIGISQIADSISY